MRCFLFLSFLTAGCALSPVSPLESLDYVSRQPAAARPSQSPRPPAPQAVKEDIYLGMEAAGVRSLWGQPETIELAGTGGYQKWVYVKEIPTSVGYVRQRRIVYFEQSRVVGWETRGH